MQMRPGNRSKWWLLTALLISVLLLWLLKSQELAFAPDAAKAPLAEEVEQDLLPDVTSSRAIPGTWAPFPPVPAPTWPVEDLPEAGLPLAAQLDALTALAEKGHPVATCRLAMGMRRCRMVNFRLEQAQRMQARLMQDEAPRLHEDMMILSIANALEQTKTSMSYCEGMEVDDALDLDALIENALPYMNTWQRVALVMMLEDGTVSRLPRHFGAPDGMTRTTDYLYPQFLSRHAYPILQQGISEANPLALEGMLMVHAPGWIPGGHASPRLALPDRREFIRYAFLMERVYGGEALGLVASNLLLKILPQINEDEQARMRARADREAAHWQALMASNSHRDARRDLIQSGDLPERWCGE